MPVMKQDLLAFDFSEANRTFDKDDRLHIKVSHLTKANVCDYLGHEIPGWQGLGLEPDRIYKLWRHPEELEKAVPTINNIQLLQRHISVNAADPKQMDTVGSTGTDAVWNPPYIDNSLVIWAKSAIDPVVRKTKGELSSSYYYLPDMTPGVTPDGVRFDGVMRDITFNHVALVELGRAGTDVAVGDEAIKPRGHTMILRKAALVALADSSQLAADEALKKVATDPTFKVVAARLANDAKRAKDKAKDVDEDEEMSDDADPEDETEAEKKIRLAKEAAAADKKARDKKAKDKSAKDKAAKDKKAKDEEREEGESDEEFEDRMKKSNKDDEDEDDKADDKKAMDAAIATASHAIAKRFADLRQAEIDVLPYVGTLAVAMDSAADVYAFALKQKGVDTKGVHASAFPAMLKMLPKPGSRPVASLAMDAAAASSLEADFPMVARIS